MSNLGTTLGMVDADLSVLGSCLQTEREICLSTVENTTIRNKIR
jgi:hypothetical protein